MLRDDAGFSMMEVVFLLHAVLTVLLASAPVQGLKKCTKITSCRCSTDEGEINLGSLAGKSEDDRPRFSIPEAVSPDVPGQTNDSYRWNPCDSWTAKHLPNRTTGCKDVAVCKIQKTSEVGTFYIDIGEQKLSDCVLKNGQCQLTYGVANEQIKTTIALVCDETEEGRVDPMRNVFVSELYSTTLYSKCACPGRCSTGLSTGAIVGIVIGSVAGFLIFAFVVFIVYLRCKLPSGGPKPSMSTTLQVGCGLIMTSCCPCCKRLQYSSIPGSPKATGPSNTTVNI